MRFFNYDELVKTVVDLSWDSYLEGTVDGGNEYADEEDEWKKSEIVAVKRILDGVLK